MSDAPPTTPPPAAAPGRENIFAAPTATDRAKKGMRSLVEWVAIVVGALLVAFVVKTFLIQAFFIPSVSMEPELLVRDRVLVNKLSYKLGDIERGDIIVFERPRTDTENQVRDLIKRVIALPGERVEGRDGRVFINGQPLDEPYLVSGTLTTDFPVRTVPENGVWVMGDNRGNSKDSRSFGPISESIVIGRAFIRVWPPGRIGLM
ncbi:MAG: signal peptidase I, partial [Acidimicrobiales bacterium]